MKVYRFKNTGLLWRLATTYGTLDSGCSRWGTDICQYTKAVLIGVAVVLCIIAGGVIAGYVALDTIAFWTMVIFLDSQIEASVGAMVGTVLLFIAALLFLIFKVDDAIRAWRRREIETLRDEEPGPVRQMYRAWKEKYCVRVTFGD